MNTTARREIAEMTTNLAGSARRDIAGYTFLGFTLDLRREVLVGGGQEMRLRPRAFGVLTYLVANAGRVVSKQELIDRVWSGVAVTDDSLVQCLIEIRRALGSTQHVVKTVRARGYLMDCDVQPVPSDDGEAALDTRLPEAAVQEQPALQEQGWTELADRQRHRRLRVTIGLVITALLATLVIAAVLSRPGRSTTAAPSTTALSTAPLAVRFSIAPPSGNVFGNDLGPANSAPNVETTTIAVSPDGSQVAYVATDLSGHTRIWLRPMAALDAQPVPATDGAQSVFWSPDGRSIGFPAGGKLKRLDLATGAAIPLCDLPDRGGVYATWGEQDILFSAGNQIFRVPTSGGTAELAVRPEVENGESGAKWPWFLPDGRRFVYLARLRTRDGRVKLAAPGKPTITVLSALSNVQWVDPGYLVFAREGTIVAQRLDPESGRTAGDPLPIAGPVLYSRSTARAAFSASRSGALAYQSHSDQAQLVWFDRKGSNAAGVASQGDFLSMRLSADGGRALFARAAPRLGTYDLWSVDLARGDERKLTSEPTSEIGGLWLPDGKGMVFSAERQGPPHLFYRRFEDDNDRELRPSTTFTLAEDVSPEGLIAFQDFNEATPRVVWSLDPHGGGEPAPLMAPKFNVEDLRFSPDGQLVTFVSNDSERPEVHVARRSATRESVRISIGGGRSPRWDRRVREVLYLSKDGRMMAVAIRTDPKLEAAPARVLFTIPLQYPWVDYDVAPDGRFLAIVPQVRANERPLTVLLNWLALLK
jgi:DNA-binding winged helix-turn-helix (wHTH) protein/Tol biopolymer transport system component